jgi:hypothetical protein
LYYDIFWLEPETQDWTRIAGVYHPKTWYVWSDDSLINGSTYYFKIRTGYEQSLLSEFTKAVEVVHMDYLAPLPPVNLKATLTGKDSIKLEWSGSPSPDVVGYRVLVNHSSSESGSGGQYIIWDEVLAFNYEFTDLAENTNTTYYFVVRAVDEANNTSPYSNEAWNSTKTQLEPERPRVASTFPENNAQNVPVNITVLINFSLPMNLTSVDKNLNLEPSEPYTLGWGSDNKELRISFSDNLDYNKTYELSLGQARSIVGGVLENYPFILVFSTEGKIMPSIKKQSFSILFPKPGTVFEVCETITISGNSSGYSEGTEIKLKIGNSSIFGEIRSNGNWSIIIPAPSEPGDYIIKVNIENKSMSISITVESRDQPITTKDDEEDKGLLGMGTAFDIILILIVMLIVIILLFLLLRGKKKGKTDYLDFEDELEVESGILMKSLKKILLKMKNME